MAVHKYIIQVPINSPRGKELMEGLNTGTHLSGLGPKNFDDTYWRRWR